MQGRLDNSVTGLVELFYSSGLNQITAGEVFDIEEGGSELDFVRFTNNSTRTSYSQAYFLGDIDKDGRDDIVIGARSYGRKTPDDEAVNSNSVTVVLANALDNLPENNIFNLDDCMAQKQSAKFDLRTAAYACEFNWSNRV
jgi:hypothetical protein